MRRSNIRVNPDDILKIRGVRFLVVRKLGEFGFDLKEVED